MYSDFPLTGALRRLRADGGTLTGAFRAARVCSCGAVSALLLELAVLQAVLIPALGAVGKCLTGAAEHQSCCHDRRYDDFSLSHNDSSFAIRMCPHRLSAHPKAARCAVLFLRTVQIINEEY